MKFQRFTCYDITEKEMGQAYAVGQSASYHWKRIMTKPHCVASREVETIFEEVRLREFTELPSRKNCLFLFDLSLNPFSYADSMDFISSQLNLVEVEILDTKPIIARVNKSLIGRRIEDGKLKATREDIVADAREYWSGLTQVNLDEEVLFSGSYRYTRIIQPPESLFHPALRKLNEASISDI